MTTTLREQRASKDTLPLDLEEPLVRIVIIGDDDIATSVSGAITKSRALRRIQRFRDRHPGGRYDTITATPPRRRA